MGTLDPDRWQALDRYLDQALEFDNENERAEWLASIRTHSPQIADDLEGLLARQRQLANERFLDATVVPRPFSPRPPDRRSVHTRCCP